MFICYLDDSGKDPQNPITTVAGYVAREEQWRKFEAEVEPIFTDARVEILHAKELHDTDNDFKDWPVLKKQAFVARVCGALAKHVPLGVSMSALKSVYAQRAAEANRKKTVTAYSFCFNAIVDWILRDVAIGRAVQEEGLAFVLESGHENNPEAEWCFYDTRQLFKLENVLRSISFLPKDARRAIQAADVVAFYTRSHGAEMVRAKAHTPPGTMLDIITEKVRHHSFVATEFGWRPGVLREREERSS